MIHLSCVCMDPPSQYPPPLILLIVPTISFIGFSLSLIDMQNQNWKEKNLPVIGEDEKGEDEVADEDGKGDEVSIRMSSSIKTMPFSSAALGAIFVVSVLMPLVSTLKDFKCFSFPGGITPAISQTVGRKDTLIGLVRFQSHWWGSTKQKMWPTQTKKDPRKDSMATRSLCRCHWFCAADGKQINTSWPRLAQSHCIPPPSFSTVRAWMRAPRDLRAGLPRFSMYYLFIHMRRRRHSPLFSSSFRDTQQRQRNFQIDFPFFFAYTFLRPFFLQGCPVRHSVQTRTSR